VLEERLAHTRRLLETLDATIGHLGGTRHMTAEDLFAGFRVAVDEDRSGERVPLGGDANDCKVSALDTAGALCAFEFRGNGGWPLHYHYEQDEWLYVVDGAVECHVGEQQYHLRAGESVFVPRKTPHVWAVRDGPARILSVYQPAGRLEQLFREVGQYVDPPIHEALSVEEMVRLFDAHGMCLLGPGLARWDA
jgi:quercetin 2,3-dioxygenase